MSEPKPKTFPDAEGRTWCPRITCDTLVRYEESTGVELLGRVYDALAAKLKPGQALKLDSLSVVSALNSILDRKMSNLVLLGYLAVENAAKKQSVTLEQFRQAMTAACVRPMIAAVGGAYSDFFQEALGISLSAAGAALGAGPTSTPAPR